MRVGVGHRRFEDGLVPDGRLIHIPRPLQNLPWLVEHVYEHCWPPGKALSTSTHILMRQLKIAHIHTCIHTCIHTHIYTNTASTSHMHLYTTTHTTHPCATMFFTVSSTALKSTSQPPGRALKYPSLRRPSETPCQAGCHPAYLKIRWAGKRASVACSVGPACVHREGPVIPRARLNHTTWRKGVKSPKGKAA